MAKGSKKGASSAHVKAAKGNCLEHNRRDYGEKNRPQYVMTNRTADNVTVFEHEDIKGRKSILPLVRRAEKLYTEKTGQKCQKSFAPYREDVLSLPGHANITNEQLMNYARKVEAETGWEVMGIWYHKDEGYTKSKHIEGEEGEAINYHAHVLFYCQDRETGKAKRNDRQLFSLRQDWLAAATGMERGNKAAETGIRGRTAMEQRVHAQEQRINELERLTREREMQHRAEMKRMAMEKEKAVQDAKASVWHSAKNLFGADKTINGLKDQINGLQRDFDAEVAQHKADVDKLRQNAQKSVWSTVKQVVHLSSIRPLAQQTRPNYCIESLVSAIKELMKSERMWYREAQEQQKQVKQLKNQLERVEQQSRGFHL